MTIRLKKQVINILRILKKKSSEIFATDLAKELKIDYIVLMSAINDLIEHDLGYFKEDEVYQISLNDEGIDYLNVFKRLEKCDKCEDLMEINDIYSVRLKSQSLNIIIILFFIW